MSQKFPWHTHTEEQSLIQQATNLLSGLTHPEAAQRLITHGQNILKDAKHKSVWKIFFSQFTDLLVVVLICAAVIAAALGEPQDTIAILAIIILNAVLGFYQEYRAEKAMAALKALTTPHARVRRHGQVTTIPAFQLVPGDIVLLEAGNIVPADLRILEAFTLQLDESLLTGESLPVEKITAPIHGSLLPIAEQKNMAFKGTLVTSGRATGLVVRTGMATELGRIATLLREEVEVKTPLQNRIARFAKRLTLAVIVLCLVIFGIGLLRGEEPVLMFLTALSLAVAAIPEALPAVVTVALAFGARAMGKKNALVRKLPAVEALGSVTTICTDKTGTLTENRMQARSYYFSGKMFPSLPIYVSADEKWKILIHNLILNNDVTMGTNDTLLGDPTETALAQAALDAGADKKVLETRFPRIAEFPFSSERGMMSTVHREDIKDFILTKGAPEKVLPLCINHFVGTESLDLQNITQAIEEMAAKGMRVLALAHRTLPRNAAQMDLSEFEKELSFIGLVGLMDPPRPEAKMAIAECKTAGIRVLMMTGDHPVTALAIAKELGLTENDPTTLKTGQELTLMNDDELNKTIRHVSVYARVAPEQKIRIVKALQAAGEIVAMTGDGVNDAPALKRADVGVSMGKGGTDVAREASHIILLDDNFATIVAAVREGRRIYDNIRKFVRFALSGNSGEVWTLFLAPFVGLPTPLLPIHILWVNLVTDGLPGLALSMEPEEKNIMRRPPRHPQESVFSQGLWQHSVWVGLLTATLTLGTMAWAYFTQHAHWQSMAFTVLTMTQMGHVLAIRSDWESIFRQGFLSNWPLFVAVLFTLVLQLCTLYIPALNTIFKTQPLTLDELMICFVASAGVFVAVEIEKFIKRRRQNVK